RVSMIFVKRSVRTASGSDRVINTTWNSRMTRSLPLAVLTLLFHGVVKLIREFRIESFKNRKLSRHAIFVVEAGINQAETIVCLRIVWLNSENFFQRCERLLVFPGLVTGVSQSVESFGVGSIQCSRL